MYITGILILMYSTFCDMVEARASCLQYTALVYLISLPLVLFSNTSHKQGCYFSHEVITNVALHTEEGY